MITPRRLPGIRIAPTPPPLAEVLPRMDIAVFVGFAATGPTHRPIAIESVAEYAAVFGDDLALAWNMEQEERIYAYLGSSVRAFFSNGGQRCWIIRVARTPLLEASWLEVSKDNPCLIGSDKPRLIGLACANHFTVPGVLVLAKSVDSSALTLESAQVQARSVGSWSDPLRVASALTVSGFELRDCSLLTSGIDKRIRFTTNARLQTGDLIEFGNTVDLSDPSKIRLYAIIDSSGTTSDASSSQLQVEARLCASFQPIGVTLESVEGKAKVVGIIADMPATLEASSLLPLESPLNASIVFSKTKQLGLEQGQWLYFRSNDAQKVLWLRIDRLGHRSSKAGPDIVDFVVEGLAWVELTSELPNPPPTRASLLSLELQVTAEQGKAFRLSDVGLTPLHRKSWWRQVSDDVFYAVSNDGTNLQPNGSQTDEQGRFPLAALDGELESPPLAWIPLGVSSLPGARLGPLPQRATALERDGLSYFNHELFLDPALASLSADSLIEQANEVRYLSNSPRGLFGIHAALTIGSGGLFNEASLIAVPDALHIGWKERSDVNIPATQAVNEKLPAHWFHHRGPCAVAPNDVLIDEPDFSQFLDCDTRLLTQPALKVSSGTVSRGDFSLSWESKESGVGFILEEAQQADFSNAHEIYRGNAFEYAVNALQEGIYYYRVTAFLGNEQSRASAIQAVVVRDDAWIQVNPKDYTQDSETTLLNIHRSLLRMAAASGELFALLGLPGHYRVIDSLRYVARLRTQRDFSDTDNHHELDFTERRALSYGALYHPWVVFASQAAVKPLNKSQTFPASSNTQLVCPPDGIATAMLAARAALRGAWIAPANQSLLDVVALTPQIQEDAWLSLQDAQINLLRTDARGFLTLSADTLADDPELRPINVRRLLILLRRLALRRGTSYVFEPNDDVLRRAVERGFTFLLTDLFRRGAFAGATVAESFRVVTSGAINTNADRDNGRFFVELRVAPSLPLKFLTIRLTQNGERLTVLEGV